MAIVKNASEWDYLGVIRGPSQRATRLHIRALDHISRGSPESTMCPGSLTEADGQTYRYPHRVGPCRGLELFVKRPPRQRLSPEAEPL